MGHLADVYTNVKTQKLLLLWNLKQNQDR